MSTGEGYCKHCGAPESVGNGPFRTPDVPRRWIGFEWMRRFGAKYKADWAETCAGFLMFLLIALAIGAITAGVIDNQDGKVKNLAVAKKQVKEYKVRLEECRHIQKQGLHCPSSFATEYTKTAYLYGKLEGLYLCKTILYGE